MSEIDQAFIRAYTDEDGYSAPVETLGPPTAQPTTSHVQLYSSSQNTQSFAAQAPTAEPMPAPHFQGSASAVAQADTVAVQRAMEEQAAVAPPSQRRPLSSFATPASAPSTVFEPVFEVDTFRWPAVTDELLDGHGELFTPVVQQLLAASEEGQSLVGIAGARPGVGCSTVHMCLARLLASAGKSVAIVDSNFAAAHLAKNLGLEFESGWEDVLTGKIPLAECVVRSNQDRMVLLPLGSSRETRVELLSSIQTSVIAGVLRYHYDLVLYDLGAAGDTSQLAFAQQIVEQCRLDASIIVADTDSDHLEADRHINALLNVLGTSCLGVIGNFTRGGSEHQKSIPRP